MSPEYTKNFLVYYNNLSTYYIICVFMSIIAIILSWVYHFKNVPSDIISEDGSDTTSKENVEEDSEFKNILSSLKESKKQSIEKYAASLTEDQLEEEKKIEREQLAAILNLLKQQEEKFHVTSMEELEGQLKLYR